MDDQIKTITLRDESGKVVNLKVRVSDVTPIAYSDPADDQNRLAIFLTLFSTCKRPVDKDGNGSCVVTTLGREISIVEARELAAELLEEDGKAYEIKRCVNTHPGQNTVQCASCAGSGEGTADGSTCMSCGGSGEAK